MTLKVDWDWLDTEVTKAGLTFSGSLSATASGTFSYSNSVGRDGESKTFSRVCALYMIY